MMPAVAATGVDRVEIYTEPYASAWGKPQLKTELEDLKATAREATRLGMKVNCGHDLNLRNTPLLAREIPEIVEASIGHALIADALELGYAATVKAYLACIAHAAEAAPRP